MTPGDGDSPAADGAEDPEGDREGPAMADAGATVAGALDVVLAPGVAAQAPTSPHAKSRASPRGIAWLVLIVASSSIS